MIFKLSLLLGLGTAWFVQHLAWGEVATANNRLALKLYYHLAKTSEGDFIFSPFSLSSLVGAMGSVANQRTAERISGAMEFNDDYLAVTNDYRRLVQEFRRLQSLNESSMEIQHNSDLKLSPEFKRLLLNYQFDTNSLKFTANSRNLPGNEESFLTTSLILGNQSLAEAETTLQMKLKSTVNFKGSWVTPFNKINTQPSPFYNMSRRPYLVPMMFQRLEVPYAEIESLDCTAISLPYRLNYTFGGDSPQSRLELLIFLPNSLTGLHDLETKLVQQPFSLTVREFKESKDLFVYLPKFQVSTEMNMQSALQQVGLDSLFLSETSDYPKMFQDLGSSNRGKFGVLKSSHFGSFSVDEFGTNGWARGALETQSQLRKHISPDVFRVDRPFVGVLYDSERNMVLLMFRKIDFESIDTNKIAIPDALAE